MYFNRIPTETQPRTLPGLGPLAPTPAPSPAQGAAPVLARGPVPPDTSLWMRHAHAARGGRGQELLGRCPVCDDQLCLGHRHPGPAAHVLHCVNPNCSYERDYDAAVHSVLDSLAAALARIEARLIRIEAHEAWLLVQVEALCARANDQEVGTCS
jgi:hypothetical protein